MSFPKRFVDREPEAGLISGTKNSSQVERTINTDQPNYSRRNRNPGPERTCRGFLQFVQENMEMNGGKYLVDIPNVGELEGSDADACEKSGSWLESVSETFRCI